MIGRLEIRLQTDGIINHQMSSLFHGAMMELLSNEYATFLHESRIHPYTQHLEQQNGEWYWIICALNQDAVLEILQNGLSKTDKILLKKRNQEIRFAEKKLETIPYQKLTECFYSESSSRYMDIQFLTPTAFKQRGRYVFYPDIRCIFQSLMNKYDASVENERYLDEETLDELCEHTEVVRYDLKSTSFHLEGVRIPSFYGKITLRFGGTQTMANFANILFRFGTYSGIGIKASIGMGAIRIIEEGGKKHD